MNINTEGQRNGIGEYQHRRSEKWNRLNKTFKEKCSVAKSNYYKNIVEDLKRSKPSQWYSKLKRMSSDQKIKKYRYNSR